jgi:ethanolamine permease
MIAAVTVINLRGLEMPRKMQIVTTIVLVAAIFGLGAAGLFIAPSAPVPVPPERPLPETFALFFGSIGFALFLFVGFEWVVPLGRNANAFVNQIPRAMQIAVLINMVMYAVFTAGVLCHVSQVEMIAGIHPQILLGETLFGRTGTMIALAMSALAIISTFNAGVMGGARLIYAMAREGYFPAPLARVSLTTGTPTTAVMVLGGVVATVSMIVIIGHLEIVFAVIASSIICIVYILQIVSLIRLRQAGKTHFRYASRVPELGKWVIVFVLALFGTLGMFAVLSVWLQVTTGVAICVALAWFSTSLLEARRTAYS